MSNRLNQEREQTLQPKRIRETKEVLKNLGFVIENETNTSLQFRFKNELVTFFPYSGWASGKSIKDGRGFKNLLNQLQ